MDTLLWHSWWVWAAAGVTLAILEVLAPGFTFLGFAIGASALAFVLLLTPYVPSVPVLLILFGVLSIVAWLVLRHFFKPPTGQRTIIEHDIND